MTERVPLAYSTSFLEMPWFAQRREELDGLVQEWVRQSKLSATPGKVESAGPVELGAHNEEIYCGRLGLSRDDLRALQSRGII